MDTLASFSALELVGFSMVLVGVVGLFFSPYRYLLSFLAAGMAYWLGIEFLSFLLRGGFGFSLVNAYLGAIGLSVLGMFAWLAATEPERARKRAEYREANYIEHTPLLEGDVPTSKG